VDVEVVATSEAFATSVLGLASRDLEKIVKATKLQNFNLWFIHLSFV